MSLPDEKKATLGEKEYRYFDVGTGEPAVVMLHGVASSKEVLFNRVKTLSLKTRMIYLDLPGTGEISMDDFDSMSDIAEYVRNLVEHLGLNNVVVLGYSMGGLVALKCREMFSGQDWLKGTVAWASPVIGSSGITGNSQMLISSMKKVPAFFYPYLNSPATLKFLCFCTGACLTEQEIEIMNKLRMDSAEKLLPMIMDYQVDMKNGSPALLIWGTKDKLVKEKNYEYASENGGKYVEAVIVENGGHFGTEEGWEEVFGHIRAFVGKVGKKA